jgi:Na+-translocating ferredoxin:NAD+ oxidoreductase subunit G
MWWILWLLQQPPVMGYTLLTREALISSYFPAVERVESVPFAPSPDVAAGIAATLGAPLPAVSYEILIGWSGGKPVSYAIIDEQLGQHEPITYAVLFDPAGKVQRVEIMVYREAYGDGVRAEPFRRQFVGRDAASPMRAGREIQFVSGSTISSRALTTGIRRDTVLIQAFLNQQPV